MKFLYKLFINALSCDRVFTFSRKLGEDAQIRMMKEYEELSQNTNNKLELWPFSRKDENDEIAGGSE